MLESNCYICAPHLFVGSLEKSLSWSCCCTISGGFKILALLRAFINHTAKKSCFRVLSASLFSIVCGNNKTGFLCLQAE